MQGWKVSDVLAIMASGELSFFISMHELQYKHNRVMGILVGLATT